MRYDIYKGKPAPHKPREPLRTLDEISSVLGMSEITLRGLMGAGAKNGKPPPEPFAMDGRRKRYYVLSDIRRWLSSMEAA